MKECGLAANMEEHIGLDFLKYREVSISGVNSQLSDSLSDLFYESNDGMTNSVTENEKENMQVIISSESQFDQTIRYSMNSNNI